MAKRRYILAVDQGTTGTHVTVLDDRLKVSGQAYREFPKPSRSRVGWSTTWKTSGIRWSAASPRV